MRSWVEGLPDSPWGYSSSKARPDTSIVIGEKREGPAPLAAFKVGESTVELSAHYFAEVVGMKDHLDAEQLPKAGLRFFFPAGRQRRHHEAGGVGLDGAAAGARPTRSTAAGSRTRSPSATSPRATTFATAREIEDVEFGDGDSDTRREGRPEAASALELQARWVVDATGAEALLKRKLGLEKDVEHNDQLRLASARRGLDIDDWSDDEEWLGRMSEAGIRKLSTNHLMGEGYWVWLIPLAIGPDLDRDRRGSALPRLRGDQGARRRDRVAEEARAPARRRDRRTPRPDRGLPRDRGLRV